MLGYDDTTATNTDFDNTFDSYRLRGLVGGFYNFTQTITDSFSEFCDFMRDINSWLNRSLLMYKGWMTVEEYLQYLYLIRLRERYEKTSGYILVVMKRKTVKGLSPVVRNHMYGRK